LHVQFKGAIEQVKKKGGEIPLIKIAILGAGGVGKSGLVIMYTQNFFHDSYDPTIEDYYRKQINEENFTFVLEIYDMAGPEEYSSLVR